MDCDLIKREHFAERYLLGSLDGDDLEAYEQHYFQCGSCFDELRQLEEIRRALMALPSDVPKPAITPGPAPARWPWPAFAALAASLGLVAFLLHEYASVPGPADAGFERTSAGHAASPASAAPRSDRLLALAHAEPPPYSPQVLRGSDPASSASFRHGMTAYAQGNYRAAAEKLRRAASNDPARPDIAFFLAASELLAGNAAQARTGFEAVIALGETPFTDEAHFYLAKAQLALGRIDAARISLQYVSPSDAALRAEADSLLQQLDSLPRD